MAQTAVEWLEEKIKAYLPSIHQKGLEDSFKEAKAMEKEQTMESWKHGNLPTFLGRVLTAEQYYNETYKK